MAKIRAHGTVFKLSDGAASPTLATVAQVANFDGPDFARDIIPTAAHDDTTWITKLAAALIDPGQITMEIEYDPNDSTHDPTTGLVEALTTGDERNNQFVFPTTPTVTWTLPSIVRRFRPKGMSANTGLLMADVELEITSAPTLA